MGLNAAMEAASVGVTTVRTSYQVGPQHSESNLAGSYCIGNLNNYGASDYNSIAT